MEASEILEFTSIKETLASIAKMEINKERLLNLTMSNDREHIEHMLRQIDEVSSILIKYGNIELVELGDIFYSVDRASKKAILSIKELYNILSSFKLILELEKYNLNISKSEYVEYYKIINNLTFVDNLYRELLKSISNDMTILDGASIKLKKIRNEISNCEADITNKLKRIIANNLKILTNTDIIYRNGKQVLAVNSSYKYSLGGIVVDESSSGATSYVEPEEVYKLTSRINVLKQEEQEEIERILTYLSQYVVSYKEEINRNFASLLELDYLFAKAKYGNRLDAKRATLGNEIKLVGAKHPLIDKNKVVSNTFIMNEKTQKIIVISGPNTGGKSVALKTLGLLAYMNQCGLLISVDREAILPVFDEIYLDLGDNQSIVSSLSTFSSHILNISNILNNANENSLVLLDEVGAGTDPKQGEALAIALIEEFYKRKSYLMLTTHYENLKTYALETDYVKVCAMDFDKLTLKPTYKLIENTIGKSYAFEIAKLYGISDEIISKADEYKEKYSNVNERALKKLEEEMEKYEVLKEENEKLKRELNMQIELAKQKEANLNALIKDVQEKAEEEKERLIKESVEQIEEILYEIRTKDNLKMHEALKAKKELEELALKEEEEKSNAVFQVGDYVYVTSFNSYGTITKKNKDVYSVNLGKMTINVKNIDLEKRVKTKTKAKVVVSNKVKLTKMSNEVNLIGMTKEEAVYEMKQFLDKARVINLSPVRIIHGFGEGILRKAVDEYLKKCDFVESYTLAGYGSGSGGATMVYLKKRTNV